MLVTNPLASRSWANDTIQSVSGAWWSLLLSGIMTIAGSISARQVLPYWGLYLALGIAEIVLSFWLLDRPGLTLVATVLAIGIWSIIYGAVLTVVAIDLKHLPGRVSNAENEVTGAAHGTGRAWASRAG
jgi:hypothetical protein